MTRSHLLYRFPSRGLTLPVWRLDFRAVLASDADRPLRVIGRVAQMVRALVSHTRGPGFDSLRDHFDSVPVVASGQLHRQLLS